MDQRIKNALEIAAKFGSTDGGHHKAWVIDQMVRALTGCPTVVRQATDCRGAPYTYEALGASAEYIGFVVDFEAGEDGPETYKWDEGIAP